MSKSSRNRHGLAADRGLFITSHNTVIFFCYITLAADLIAADLIAADLIAADLISADICR